MRANNAIKSTEDVYTYLKDKIVTGEYKPSEKLVESILATELKVSRNTVKNALLMLQKENLIEIEKHKGASVKAFTLDEVINYLEIREALEGIIIKSVVSEIQDEDLEKLEHIIEKMEEYIKEGNLNEYSELNREFHNIIYSISKNVQAVELVSIIKTQLIRFHFRTILAPNRSDQSLIEHKRIFESLKKRDKDAAVDAIQTHISHVRKTIKEYYQFLI